MGICGSQERANEQQIREKQIRIWKDLDPPSGRLWKMAEVMGQLKTDAWNGNYRKHMANNGKGVTFTHAGKEMPVDAFLGWCSGVGAAGSFKKWQWTNVYMEIMDDGRLKVGTQQTSSKMIKDVPPIGPFPPILLSKVPKDSPLLTDVGCVLPIEIGYYTFNDDFKITKIEYKGFKKTPANTPPMGKDKHGVGPPILYMMAGQFDKFVKTMTLDALRTDAWNGTYKKHFADGAIFIHGGKTMPVDAFLGWCTGVGKAGSFKNWQWSNVEIKHYDDGRMRVGTQQTSSKMVKDVPAIGPFPPIVLNKVPRNSPLLTESGAVLPVEIGYYHFNNDFKITKIEYDGTLDMSWDGFKRTPINTPGNRVGPPVLYEMAGQMREFLMAMVLDQLRTDAWEGKYQQHMANNGKDTIFIHGGKEMPVDAFLGWCSGVGAAGTFKKWQWTNTSMEFLADGRVKLGTQQTSSKMVKDCPAIGPFPEMKLNKVPKDSPLLTDAGAVLPVEIGYYTFNDQMKITKIEYKGELDMTWEGFKKTPINTPPLGEHKHGVGPPILYAMAGQMDEFAAAMAKAEQNRA